MQTAGMYNWIVKGLQGGTGLLRQLVQEGAHIEPAILDQVAEWTLEAIGLYQQLRDRQTGHPRAASAEDLKIDAARLSLENERSNYSTRQPLPSGGSQEDSPDEQ